METKRSYNGPKRPSEKNFVFGIHPVTEALESGKNLDSIVVHRSSPNERISKVLSFSSSMGVPIKNGPSSKARRYHFEKPPGHCSLFLSPITYQPLEEIVMGAYERGETPALIAADGITDVRNLGAITSCRMFWRTRTDYS